MPKANLSKIRALPVPVCDIKAQDLVLAVLDTTLPRIDAAVASLTRAKANVANARASVLKAAVEGRLVPTEHELAQARGRPYENGQRLLERMLQAREGASRARGSPGRHKSPIAPADADLPPLPSGWTYCRIDTAGEVRLGRQRAPKYHHGPGMRPYLRVANVFEARIDLDDLMEMSFSPEEYETYRLLPRDILLNEGQSPHMVGRPAMWHGEREGMCFTNSLIRFRAVPGVNPDYALVVFRAQLSARRYMRLVTITTNIAHLSAGRFAAVEFPLPPEAEQARIAAEVGRRMSVLDAIERTLDDATSRCTVMRQAILSCAFEGRLVSSQRPAASRIRRGREVERTR